MSTYDKSKLETKIQIETNDKVHAKKSKLRPTSTLDKNSRLACFKIDQAESQKRSNRNSRQSVDNCKVSKNKLFFCPAQAGSLIMRNMC